MITALPPLPFLQQMQLFHPETPVPTESPMCLLKSSSPQIALTLQCIVKWDTFILPSKRQKDCWNENELMLWQRIQPGCQPQAGRGIQGHQGEGDLMPTPTDLFSWNLEPGAIITEFSFVHVHG